MILWLTITNVFFRSRNSTITIVSSSRDLVILSTKVMRVWWVECHWLNPNWFWYRTLYWSKNWINLLYISLSNILEKSILFNWYMEFLNVSQLKSPIINISLFSEVNMVNISFISFINVVLSVLGGLNKIITYRYIFLLQFTSDLSIFIITLLNCWLWKVTHHPQFYLVLYCIYGNIHL